MRIKGIVFYLVYLCILLVTVRSEAPPCLVQNLKKLTNPRQEVHSTPFRGAYYIGLKNKMKFVSA